MATYRALLEAASAIDVAYPGVAAAVRGDQLEVRDTAGSEGLLGDTDWHLFTYEQARTRFPAAHLPQEENS